jgi:hypothetical protein
MKRILLSALAVFAFATMSAQDFNAGLNVGLPIGDAGDAYTFNITLDVSALWEVSESFDAGVATGLSYNLGDEIAGFSIDDAIFLPIAAAGRFAVSEDFTLGADLGYALGLAPDGNDGGFYYAPRVQYGVSDALDIVLSYRGVSDDGSFDVINLGVEFGF